MPKVSQRYHIKSIGIINIIIIINIIDIKANSEEGGQKTVWELSLLSKPFYYNSTQKELVP